MLRDIHAGRGNAHHIGWQLAVPLLNGLPINESAFCSSAREGGGLDFHPSHDLDPRHTSEPRPNAAIAHFGRQVSALAAVNNRARWPRSCERGARAPPGAAISKRPMVKNIEFLQRCRAFEGSVRRAPRLLLTAAAAVLASIALTLATPARSAQPTMSFVRVGAEQGLSQGAVMSILQDHRGFLWLGTEDGLNRYDGNELKHFIRKRDDPSALPSNWISSLAEDGKGRIWIGTDGDGLVWRDVLTGQFRRPLSASGQMLLDPQARIRTLDVDRHQRLWVATRQSGLIVLDIANGTSREFRRDLTDPHALSDDSVFAITEDASGQIWVGTGNGLDRLDPEASSIQQYGARLRQLAGSDNAPVKVNSVLADSRGTVWAGTDNGLYRLDVPGSSLTLLKHSADDEDSLPNDRVNALLEDDERRLWVGTAGGLALLDRRSGKFTVFRNEPANPESLPESNIIALYQDRSGLLWIGTKHGGMARWNPRSWAFGHFRFRDSDSDNVTSFGIDSRGTLWVGSVGGGVTAVDPRSSTAVRYSSDPHSPLRLGDDNVMALVVDEKDRIWLGTMGAGVERLDTRSGKVRRYTPSPNDPSSLPVPGVMSLMRGGHGAIWVGTYGGGLVRIDPDKETVVRYPVSHDGGAGLSSDRATALAEDPAGLIWIGTDGGGLNVLDPVSGRFRSFVHDPRDPASLSSNTVYALHVDERGRVWVGTRGGGLDRVLGNPLAPESLKFSNFSESDGLPNSAVYGIESDAVGRLWLSTNRGVAAYDPETRSVRTFKRSHGLQGDEFNFGAHYRGADGTVYFGGPNGYNAFLPERLRFNTRPPQVALTELLKLNTPVSATPDTLTDVELGFRDSVVTFRFAALDFTGPRENRYQHRLEGFDKQWVDAGNLGQATYTNLSGGHYVFQVRAANSDGAWNETGLAIGVGVAPPPWATWWARALYAAALVAVIFGVWFTQKRRIDREAAYARRLKAEVDAQTAEIAERNRQMEIVNQHLREASVTDPLTGLGNRRSLREAMVAIEHGGAATGSTFMIVDLDYLKPINDEHGHEGGDAVLIRVAEILRHLFRSSDLIVRWGGDEFVVLCRGCDLTTAGTLAERVRAAVSKTIFRVGEGVVARTSCSIGFATVPFIAQYPQLLNWEQSMNLADAALYRAKQDRNTWFGWGGTAAAAAVPSLLAAIDADATALERDGVLDVRRRPLDAEDTVDQMRAIARLDPR